MFEDMPVYEDPMPTSVRLSSGDRKHTLYKVGEDSFLLFLMPDKPLCVTGGELVDWIEALRGIHV